MRVYRLSKTKYCKDLTGEGSRQFGGRWNKVGTACIYTSQSRALAVLEYTVNTNIDDIPRALSMIEIEIPEHLITKIDLQKLPGDWMQNPSPNSTKEFGTEMIERSLIIEIPSIVIPDESNYILNPNHLQSNMLQISNIYDFVFDIRIKY